MKKLCMALAAVLLFAALVPATAFAFDANAVYGDANGDGKVNSRDVTLIMKAIVANDPGRIIFANSDVNLDSKVNSKDIVAIMKSLAGVTTVRLGHSDTLEVITPSTCKDHGVGKLTCKECGSEATVSLPLGEHEYTSKVTTAPTCVKTGVRTYTCKVCGKSYTETVLANGHSFADGKCTVCGKNVDTWYEYYFVDNFGDPTNERYITCVVEGKYSDSVTKEGELGVRFLIQNDGQNGYQVSFELYKFVSGSLNQIRNTGSSPVAYGISVKTSDGKVYSFSGEMAENNVDRVYIYSFDESEVIVKSLQKGETSFHVVDSSNRSNTYTFTVINGDFKDAMNFLG